MLSAASAVPQRRGATDYANGALAAGDVIVVAAGSNINGIIVRTAAMVSVAGSNTYIKASTTGIMILAHQATWVDYRGMGLLISPGVALIINSNLAGGQAYLTYDIL
jgi:methionine aminopeptidase